MMNGDYAGIVIVYHTIGGGRGILLGGWRSGCMCANITTLCGEWSACVCHRPTPVTISRCSNDGQTNSILFY
jgi:hypothetical protein